MKKQILNELGQRFKTKLLLLCLSITLFSGACKKELYDSSITPPSQKDPFLTELYHNLLKNDAQYHILDQLQPTDRLGWERMMVRYKGGKAAPFNYVMPVIHQGSTTDRLIQFSFSRDNKLVNIGLLSYNNNLRLPTASDSLNSSYVKNEQTGNILACMSKNGLAVSDKLSKRASSISPSDMHKVATSENLKQAKPQALMSLPNKAAAKPIGTNAKIMGVNDGSGCSITVDFDFLFTYSTYYSIDEDNVFNYAHPNNNNGISYNRTAADDLDRFFTEYLNNSEYDYEDRSNAFQNQIVFFGVGPVFTSPVTSRVYDALQYATQQTAFSQGFDMYMINYFFPRTSSTCFSSGSSGGVEPAPSTTTQFLNKIDGTDLKDCFKTVLASIKDLSDGSVAGIIQKFSGVVPGYNWVLKDGTLDPNTNGTTSSFYDRVNGITTTTFDSQKYSNGSDIAIARTILHESVHAYLVAYFGANQPLAKMSYPEFLEEYERVKHPDINAIQHDEMTRSFKDDIAKALAEYGDARGYSFANQIEKDQFYSDMAWGGLEATAAYQALSSTDKNRIQDTILSEQYGTDRNGNPKSAKGSPSGCN